MTLDAIHSEVLRRAYGFSYDIDCYGIYLSPWNKNEGPERPLEKE
jgi:hypothetical protein